MTLNQNNENLLTETKEHNLKILSWNLLHRSGAMIDEICALVHEHKPDLMLMQEVTSNIDPIHNILGGHYHRQPWATRRHGLAIWSNNSISERNIVDLPYSKIPGSFPQRTAQLIRISNITIANVHLSHGQFLNRRQLSKIARNTEGPTAIIGDYNAIGPIALKKFSDAGPWGITHKAQKLIPFRLDRCMIRDLTCVSSTILCQGNSDHNPILVNLSI